MPYAVEMTFDEKSNDAVIGIWKQLSEYNVCNYMYNSGSIPHITLGIFEEYDIREFEKRIQIFIKEINRIKIKLASIGTFPTDERVIFLAPVVSNEVLQIHNKFNEVFSDYKGEKWSHYLPGNWFPHCTIAINLTNEKFMQAIDLLKNKYKPLEVEICKISLVEFHPVIQLKSYDIL